MANKGPSSQSYHFSSSHLLMWDLDHKEGWAPSKWRFQIVLEKTLESPLDCKGIKPVNPKGNQPWIFIGRTDAEAEASILWPPDAKSHFIGKDRLMLKLKLQYFGHLMRRAISLEKTLMLGKIEGKMRRGWQRMRWLDNNTNSMDINLSNSGR